MPLNSFFWKDPEHLRSKSEVVFTTELDIDAYEAHVIDSHKPNGSVYVMVICGNAYLADFIDQQCELLDGYRRPDAPFMALCKRRERDSGKQDPLEGGDQKTNPYADDFQKSGQHDPHDLPPNLDKKVHNLFMKINEIRIEMIKKARENGSQRAFHDDEWVDDECAWTTF